MSSPTLKDIYDVMNRLEDKLDKRVKCVEDDIEVIKDWKSNLMGKISIIGAIVGGLMGIVTSIITAFIAKRI